MPSTKYKKNFLKNVIFRIDHENISISDLQESFIKTTFPKSFRIFPKIKIEEQNTFKANVDTKTNKIVHESLKSSYIVLSNSDGKKRIEIRPEFTSFAFNDSSYSDFSDFKKAIVDFLDIYLPLKGINIFNRIGLRFVDSIDAGDEIDYKWSEWIDKSLLTASGFAKTNMGSITKELSSIETMDDYVRNRMIFGTWNKDYPNVSIRPSFILDYDVYMEIAVNSEEYKEKIDTFHEKISKIFKKSVTKKFLSFLDK